MPTNAYNKYLIYNNSNNRIYIYIYIRMLIKLPCGYAYDIQF